jgi:hypothetical protein
VKVILMSCQSRVRQADRCALFTRSLQAVSGKFGRNLRDRVCDIAIGPLLPARELRLGSVRVLVGPNRMRNILLTTVNEM